MKFKTKYFSYPYLVLMAIFIILPILLVLLYSFTEKSVDGITSIKFTLDNFGKFFQPMYLSILGKSLRLAILSTIICLIIGFPVAYIISKSDISKRSVLLFLCILPMWMNMLLRTYAWMTILGNNGLINQFIMFLGLPRQKLLYNDFAVVLGMVYNFLPFMVLPIYTGLSKLDKHFIEAAEDLGANSFTVFRKIIIPLSMPGVVSGIIMVFMPAVSTFIIPRLLGGSKDLVVGSLIENLFITSGDWNFGSAIAIIMMIIILIAMTIMNRFDIDKGESTGLW